MGAAFVLQESGDELGRLEKISSTVPGAVLALLPNGKVADIGRRSSAVFREKYFSSQQHWPNLAVFESASLLCLDSYSGGFPRQLYPISSDEVADWDNFRQVIDGLIKSVANNADVRGEILKRVDGISTIFFELFKNTHDHARFGVSGEIIGDSVRGMYSRFYSIDWLLESVMSKPEHAFNNAEHYVRKIISTQPNMHVRSKKIRDITGFLELSVFDSGPGLAAKWLGRDVTNDSAQVQFDAVMECFGKGRSSLPSSGRGFGLWKVLQQIRSIKGLIRVRTNRVHVMRHFATLENFQADTHSDGFITPKETLFDWRRGFTTKLDDYPPIEGTLISVLLPLGDL